MHVRNMTTEELEVFLYKREHLSPVIKKAREQIVQAIDSPEQTREEMEDEVRSNFPRNCPVCDADLF